MSIPIYT